MAVWRDTVVLRSSAGADQTFNTGLQQGCDTMEGWDDTPPVESVIVPRSIRPGAFLGATPRLKEKYLTLGGHLLADSRAAVDQLRSALLTTLSVGVEVEVQRGQVSAFGWVYDSCGFDLVTNQGYRWTAPLVQVDPFKYGPAVAAQAGGNAGTVYGRTYTSNARTYTSNARTYALTDLTSPGYPTAATVSNDGTADSYRLTTTLNGPLSAGQWAITNAATGGRLEGDIDVPAGSTLVIDHATGSALLAGTDVADSLVGEFLYLRPGSNTLYLEVDAVGTAWMDLTYRSAYR